MSSRHSPKSSQTIRSLLRALEEAYDHRAWHGTNLRGSLRRLSPAQALWRPAAGRHNIWEEVLHAAYWKYALRKRLICGKRGQFPLKGSNWFASPKSADPREWKQALALLQQTHDSLLQSVAQFPAARLHRPVHGPFPAFDAILGIAFHDIYHAGQIQLLKRLQKA